ncbi:hypothetical protein [Leclercia sp. AS011]|uniref:hypothetical protein n=1 Tax=Leclercia sp. AS011 TaxID=3081257 RepID=UPI00301979C0
MNQEIQQQIQQYQATINQMEQDNNNLVSMLARANATKQYYLNLANQYAEQLNQMQAKAPEPEFEEVTEPVK